jgi:hypothetical protein
MARLTKFLHETKTGSTDIPAIEHIRGADAAKLICSGSFTDDAGFDTVEAERLGVKIREVVSITPSDNGTIIKKGSQIKKLTRFSRT